MYIITLTKKMEINVSYKYVDISVIDIKYIKGRMDEREDKYYNN